MIQHHKKVAPHDTQTRARAFTFHRTKPHEQHRRSGEDTVPKILSTLTQQRASSHTTMKAENHVQPSSSKTSTTTPTLSLSRFLSGRVRLLYTCSRKVTINPLLEIHLEMAITTEMNGCGNEW